ncbi:Puratrophin-1 [Merluccius polli]|uniref:Puratrophin-1 n=1 Tax=Merluccius polli TaxID=89951 RepID=A0AA47N1P6_MERPO|nr:Puratrophin-1 [Merluccius polli]
MQVLLASYRCVISNVLQDSQLVDLQKEGGASLCLLRQEESSYNQTDDYREEVGVVERLYQQVDELTHSLVKLCNARSSQMDFLLTFSRLELGFSQVGGWIQQVGFPSLRSLGEVDGSSSEQINKKLKDFTQFSLTAERICQQGQGLLQRLSQWDDLSSASLNPYRVKVHSLGTLLQEFSEGVDATGARLHKSLALYQFYNKAYDWALQGLRCLETISMQDCTEAGKCQAVIGRLESSRRQHPPIPEREFLEMRGVAEELRSASPLQLWTSSWRRCQETHQDFHRKMEAALRTREHLLLCTSSNTSSLLPLPSLLLTNTSVTPPSSHVTPPSSHVTPLSSHVIPPSSSNMTPPTSSVTLPSSHVTLPASHMTPPTSHVTLPSSHVTPPTSSVTPPSSHVTPLTSSISQPSFNMSPPPLLLCDSALLPYDSSHLISDPALLACDSAFLPYDSSHLPCDPALLPCDSALLIPCDSSHLLSDPALLSCDSSHLINEPALLQCVPAPLLCDSALLPYDSSHLISDPAFLLKCDPTLLPCDSSLLLPCDPVLLPCDSALLLSCDSSQLLSDPALLCDSSSRRGSEGWCSSSPSSLHQLSIRGRSLCKTQSFDHTPLTHNPAWPPRRGNTGVHIRGLEVSQPLALTPTQAQPPSLTPTQAQPPSLTPTPRTQCCTKASHQVGKFLSKVLSLFELNYGLFCLFHVFD